MGTIKCLILDVDGTMTDGSIQIADNGELFKTFHVKDGYAIKNLLPEGNIVPAVVTARSSEIVMHRCRELDIVHCYQGIENKLEFVREELLPALQLSFDNVAYIGDDIPDYSCMRECAIRGCPADAVKQIRDICQFVSSKDGGKGAVREFVEFLIEWNEKGL